jgi:hypothetical protein
VKFGYMWDISEISYMRNTHATDAINEYKLYVTTYHVTEIESNPIQQQIFCGILPLKLFCIL